MIPIGEMITDLKNHKVQSIINFIGLFLGMIVIVIVTLVSNLVYQDTVAKSEQKNGFKTTVQSGVSGDIIAAIGYREIHEVLDKDIIARGAQYYFAAETTASVVKENVNSSEPVSTMIYAGNIDKVRRLPLISGQWFDETSNNPLNSIVVNDAAAKVYGQTSKKIDVRINDMYSPLNLTVLGVAKDGESAPRLYIPIRTLEILNSGTLPSGAPYQLSIHGDNANASSLVELGRNALHDIGVQESEMQLQRVDQIDETFDGLSGTITAFYWLSILVFIISGFSILNAGLIATRNKQKEFALRRSVGASRMFIFALALGSCVMLVIFAIILTIAATCIITTLIPQFILGPNSLITSVAFPASAIFGGATISLLVSII
ncbi:MAG: ABC transporter permease, partial [Candidatus Ancillula sp.]|nr:ABC transporter permease [Candidatus Ancillula sp.]